MKRGILGGAFDPPHKGHLFLAETAREQLGLKELRLIPSRVPPHKDGPVASVLHRYAMVALLCAGRAGLRPDPVELNLDGASYTLNTLEALEQEGPFVLILGADMLEDFPHWHLPREILERAALGVFPREGRSPSEVLGQLPAWLAERAVPAVTDGLDTGQVALFEQEPPHISSTAVRQALKAGKASGSLTPEVAEYIEKTGIYG